MSNSLKQYREVRQGAILAALWTKTTGSKHFVSFPSGEPADVEIYTLESIDHKGTPSFNLARVPVQLTRCSLPDGETIVGQITNKNKPTLKKVTLVVHVTASDGDELNLNAIAKQVQAMSPLYPREIAIVAPIADPTSDYQSFGQVLLSSSDSYGQIRSSTVNLGDTKAFFDNPPIMKGKRGTGQAIEADSQINLMLP